MHVDRSPRPPLFPRGMATKQAVCVQATLSSVSNFFDSFIIVFSILSGHRFYVSALWTSRGHRCYPLSLPPGVSMPSFYLAEGSAFPRIVDLHGILPTRALALSAMYTGMSDRRESSSCRSLSDSEDNNARYVHWIDEAHYLAPDTGIDYGVDSLDHYYRIIILTLLLKLLLKLY